MSLVYVRAFNLAEARKSLYPGDCAMLQRDQRPPLGVPCVLIGFEGCDTSPWAMYGALTVRMDDVHHAVELVGGGTAVPPSEDIARTIVEYLKPHGEGREPWALLVHCHAGISRSGAVAHWAWQKWGQAITGREFERLNARIYPNHRLLCLLREVSK